MTNLSNNFTKNRFTYLEVGSLEGDKAAGQTEAGDNVSAFVVYFDSSL